MEEAVERESAAMCDTSVWSPSSCSHWCFLYKQDRQLCSHPLTWPRSHIVLSTRLSYGQYILWNQSFCIEPDFIQNQTAYSCLHLSVPIGTGFLHFPLCYVNYTLLFIALCDSKRKQSWAFTLMFREGKWCSNYKLLYYCLQLPFDLVSFSSTAEFLSCFTSASVPTSCLLIRDSPLLSLQPSLLLHS